LVAIPLAGIEPAFSVPITVTGLEGQSDYRGMDRVSTR
jgi:hypothetical protein